MASGASPYLTTDIADTGVDEVPTIPSVLPNEMLSSVDLPGQFDSIPGGASANGAYPGGAADPSGINSIFINEGTNPTPTGGYQSVAAAIAQAAATGFSTYVKGSPSVATPAPRLPGSSITNSAVLGKTNWLVIGVVVIVGVGAIAWLARAA